MLSTLGMWRSVRHTKRARVMQLCAFVRFTTKYTRALKFNAPMHEAAECMGALCG